MRGFNFTDRVRKVLAMAREEAHERHHEYVGTEHLLLGLVREGGGVAAAVLRNLGMDLEAIRRRIDETVKTGKPRQASGRLDLPYTSRSQKVLELAMQEAALVGHTTVGTEHLLLGLCAEAKGIAALVLSEAGLTPDKARAEVLRIVGPDEGPPQGSASAAGIVGIAIEVRYADGSDTREDFGSVARAMGFLKHLVPRSPASGESRQTGG